MRLWFYNGNLTVELPKSNKQKIVKGALIYMYFFILTF